MHDHRAEGAEPAGHGNSTLSDYLVVELHLAGELPPETAPEPVRMALYDLAARLCAELGVSCSPEVWLLTPDDPDSVIDHAHLAATLTVVHHDVLGRVPARSQAERMLARVRMIFASHGSSRLAHLKISSVTATLLHSLEEWRL